jgi:hypothetical protein
VIELYAIAQDPGPALPDGAGLHAVSSGGLVAVCGAVAGREPTTDALWRHEELMESLMEDRDLLPVRYGTRVDDDAAVARVLEERRGDLLAALDRVRGAVELSVRVRMATAEAPDPAALIRGADVHEPLARLARDSDRRLPRLQGEVLRAAYLVERDGVQAFVAEVARLQDARPELRLLCTGPWPPYSFTQR